MNMRGNIFRNYRHSVPALLLTASLLSSSIASADPAAPAAPASDADNGEKPAAQSAGEACSAAYERTQTEKLAGHYLAASAAALECSQLQCNSAIVQECVRFYGTLETETPSLVFSAKKEEGGELIDVRVEMDGKPAAERITGQPFKLDPGPHEFVFIHKQRGRLTLNETARVGDKARVIEMSFPDPNAKAAAAAERAKKAKAVPVMSWVLGGVGVIGLGAFAYFHFSGVSDYNNYNSETGCSPRCNPDDVDSVRRKFTLSYVSVGVGAAALVGAGAVYLLRPKGDAGPTVQASVTPRTDGAFAGLKATF